MDGCYRGKQRGCRPPHMPERPRPPGPAEAGEHVSLSRDLKVTARSLIKSSRPNSA